MDRKNQSRATDKWDKARPMPSGNSGWKILFLYKRRKRQTMGYLLGQRKYNKKIETEAYIQRTAVTIHSNSY